MYAVTSRAMLISVSSFARQRVLLSSRRSIQSTFSTNMLWSDYPMILSERPPICNLVPPGQCQFNPIFQSVPLLNRISCGTGGTSYLLRFGLPDMSKPMDLTTCACILASANLMDDEKGSVVEVTRPYTPRLARMIRWVASIC